MLSPEADLRLPRVEYTSRLAQRRGVAERAKARYRMVGSLRIAVFVIELILAGLAFGVHLLSPWWLIAPLVIFGVLLIWHEHVGRAMRRADRAACYYNKGLAEDAVAAV